MKKRLVVQFLTALGNEHDLETEIIQKSGHSELRIFKTLPLVNSHKAAEILKTAGCEMGSDGVGYFKGSRYITISAHFNASNVIIESPAFPGDDEDEAKKEGLRYKDFFDHVITSIAQANSQNHA